MGLRANFWKNFRSSDVIALVELLFLPWGTHSDIYELRILVKGAWSFLFSFFSKLLRFWYHKNCHIFLIIILKFHALIPLRLEENCKNTPILMIWW